VTRPKLLDLFCCAGGAAVGYHRAGFEVVGVDVKPQPRFPFEFRQGDALEYLREHGQEFDAIHASPPCQKHSTMTAKWGRRAEHPDLIAPTRKALVKLGKPYVLENVVGAPLYNAVMLCGSMFGLRSGEWYLERHRLFESCVMLWVERDCRHTGKAIPVYGHSGGSSRRDGKKFPWVAAWREAMGIDWMTGAELAEAIPPAYTEYIGTQLMRYLCRNSQEVGG
jgi:DNA (cytosine-5)-methyltransferase 1